MRHLDWIFGLRDPRCALRRGVPSRVGGRMGWLNETVTRFASTLLLLVMMGATDHALALDRAKHIDQYGHDVWTSQNGLPGQMEISGSFLSRGNTMSSSELMTSFMSFGTVH